MGTRILLRAFEDPDGIRLEVNYVPGRHFPPRELSSILAPTTSEGFKRPRSIAFNVLAIGPTGKDLLCLQVSIFSPCAGNRWRGL